VLAGQVTRIEATELDVFRLCLGGNVFGWTADQEASFAVLDAYRDAGGNFVDTADLYAGAESERIIGEWLARSGNRSEMVVATKVGMAKSRPGLGADNIRAACEDSLRRLATDYIDLYYAHQDDPDTPQEETLEAFNQLVQAGKVKYIGASNFSAERLAASLEISDGQGWARYVMLQPHFNLVERDIYEGELQELCRRENIGCAPYFGLAKGFLTGKYRRDGEDVDSPRAARAAEYLERGSEAVLEALDEVAAARGGMPVAAVALAWLAAQPTVVAPIASARSVEQLEELLPMVSLELTDGELTRLDQASRQIQT
jgi:aryl-alcohol dehydrogenase-like predicted oxidoreductase